MWLIIILVAVAITIAVAYAFYRSEVEKLKEQGASEAEIKRQEDDLLENLKAALTKGE